MLTNRSITVSDSYLDSERKLWMMLLVAAVLFLIWSLILQATKNSYFWWQLLQTVTSGGSWLPLLLATAFSPHCRRNLLTIHCHSWKLLTITSIVICWVWALLRTIGHTSDGSCWPLREVCMVHGPSHCHARVGRVMAARVRSVSPSADENAALSVGSRWCENPSVGRHRCKVKLIWRIQPMMSIQ